MHTKTNERPSASALRVAGIVVALLLAIGLVAAQGALGVQLAHAAALKAPAIAKIVKLSSTKAKQLTVKVKKAKRATGYQYKVSLNKKFKKAKKYATKTVKSKKRTVTVKKLKAGKRYWVKVRAYAKKSSKTKWGKWGKAKSVIVSKVSTTVQDSVSQKNEKKALAYKYSVRPMLAPFNNIVYVQTENPNPSSFALTDKSSALAADSGGVANPFVLLNRNYLDVKYEKTKTYRVKGGYLFYCYECDADGGTLTLQVKNASDDFVDTSLKVACAPMTNCATYLIDTYAKGASGFFDKLDAVQSALTALAVYPHSVKDSSKPNSARPYPLLAASPYVELGLNIHVGSMFEDASGGLLMSALYPFVLDSASFPGTMSAVARKLNPNCKVSGVDSMHWMIDVELDGQTQSYGGAGEGSTEPFYSKYASSLFTFDGSATDWGTHVTLEELRAKYIACADQSDVDTAEYEKQVSGEARAKAVGPGAWVQIATEGWFGFGGTLAYITNGPNGNSETLSQAWVDGRYVNEYERWEPGAKFADHPQADVVVRNQTYKDKDGKEHTSDIVYNYDSETDTWLAKWYYAGDWWYSSSMELPEQFILTRAQVEAMGVDSKTSVVPEKGVIFDGTAKPGTPFGN